MEPARRHSGLSRPLQPDYYYYYYYYYYSVCVVCKDVIHVIVDSENTVIHNVDLQSRPARLRLLRRGTTALPPRSDVQFQSPVCPAHQARRCQDATLSSVSAVTEALRDGYSYWQTARGTQSKHYHYMHRFVSFSVQFSFPIFVTRSKNSFKLLAFSKLRKRKKTTRPSMTE